MSTRHDWPNPTSLANSFFTWIYRTGCKAVVWIIIIIIIGGLSLYMVLVSYSSAIKLMFRLMKTRGGGGQERAMS